MLGAQEILSKHWLEKDSEIRLDFKFTNNFPSSSALTGKCKFPNRQQNIHMISLKDKV